jgi:hypothetical protein
MSSYDVRVISFTLPRDTELIRKFDKLSKEVGGATKAGHLLIEQYSKSDLTQEIKSLKEHILALRQALPGLSGLVVEAENGDKSELEIGAFFE